MTPLLLALAVTSSTSTAATWRDAAVEWEVLAETERAAHLVTKARLEAERASSDLIAKEADLTVTKQKLRLNELALRVLEAETERDARVTRTNRLIAVGGAVACTLGVAAAVGGLAGCESGTCREVAGIGGGLVGAAGCITLGVAW